MLLVETAGEALEALSHDENAEGRDSEQAIRERILRFRELAARYFTLVNVCRRFEQKAGSACLRKMLDRMSNFVYEAIRDICEKQLI